ncbi:MAG: multiheme c-type cytochrome [Thermodesulfobacteriota bacterium]|nr:multiheme c-type cytochrome [Thermodesulfobacteriota bacterium]
MRSMVKVAGYVVVLMYVSVQVAMGAGPPVSEATEACLDCHRSLNPGIVASWEKGRMARVTPRVAKSMISKKRRVSFDTLPDGLAGVVVGCAECHTMNPEKHQDTFEHNGYQVHTVVSPQDCAVCHPVELEQYRKNLMCEAYGNLRNNPVYHGLADSVNGIQTFAEMKTTYEGPDAATDADSCFYCHGTVVEVKGMETRDTADGEMSFPVLSGWPNHGVGRINPDGSKGSCGACHARHRFSIQMARKPATCSECHKGPDVPAYKVYMVSKHGNIYASLGKEWDYKAVPWTVGEDFTAPTCATCHVSLVVSPEGEVVAERTHQMNDRLSWRIFGLIYAHGHPKSADTTVIQNRAGLPLPTELTGEPVAEYLIDEATQQQRRETMRTVCLTCHSRQWVDGQFSRYENTIRTTNEMTLTATKILLAAWEKGAAAGLGQNDSIFNEAIEKKWVEQWLFYANSTRYSSAMAGADYGVFANGRWYMSKNIQEMSDWLKFKLTEKK